ncbi:MAG: hypothetical protein H6735_28375 [Alphaproteobacteria bacterium]|nr:hypothetical protein [Alphaproteobacteria bacterium]
MSDAERITALERRVAELEGQLSMVWEMLEGKFAPPAPPAPPDPARDVELLDELRRGNKIAAIKRYRELTGQGLAVSKQAVEDLGAKLGLR